jgi:hypothetical protein
VAELSETEKKVYLMITITTDDVRGFNTFWAKESLPYWLKFGIKHVGSYINWVGGPLNADDEIIRIFEFENFKKYGEWEDWLHSSEGQELMKKLRKFNFKSQRRLLHSAPTS